jgi:hypothetical protein
MEDAPTTVRRREALFNSAYFSGLSLWAVLMVAPLAVLLASATMADGPTWNLLLKFTIALLLAMIPGWIYLLFIKNKGQSLYDEYVLNLFRLKIDAVENLPAPPQHTNYYRLWNEAHQGVRRYLAEVGDKSRTPTKDNLYRKKFETIYGRGSVSTIEMIDGRRRILTHTETFSPVLFATVLICIGWVLILPPRDPSPSTLQRYIPGDILEALKFAFFGVYAFTLQDLVRRYFRDDLRAGAYLGLVVRIVFVGLIIGVIGVAFDAGSDSMPAIAFVIGFFPQAGLQLILELVQKPLGKFIPNLRTVHPLSELDGLNIWYETRLSEEGIDDMQTLATASFVDLMLKTRAPIARLVDWMDQAFLALHVWPADLSDDKAKSSKRSATVKRLRGLGIRTATDLERTWSARKDDSIFCRLLSRALGVAEEEGPPVVESILVGLRGEANMWHIREFRHHRWLDRRLVGYLMPFDPAENGRARRRKAAVLEGSAPTNGVPLAG